MRISIIVDENSGLGFITNAVACISSVLFYDEKDLLGTSIEGENFTYIPITKIPIMIFKRNKKDWEELLKRAKRNKLKYMVFTREGQSTTNYEEYISRVKGKPMSQVNVIAFGVLGEDNLINSFSGDLALLK